MEEWKIDDLRKICVPGNIEPGNIEITLHAAKRLEQRQIKISDVMECIQNGEIIEQYPNDYPYPSCLILGRSKGEKRIHVVVGSNGKTIWIVTAYEPDLEKWEYDLKTRKGEK